MTRTKTFMVLASIVLALPVLSQELSREGRTLKNMIDRKANKSDTSRYVMPWEKSPWDTAYQWGNHALQGYTKKNIAQTWTAEQSFQSMNIIGRLRQSYDSVAYAVGNSITWGYGASTIDKSYAQLIAADRGWRIIDKSIPGGQMAHFMTNITAIPVLQNTKSIALLGYNDMRNYGNSAAAISQLGRMASAIYAWLTIPDAKKIGSRSASVTYTGTWANISVWTNALGKYSSADSSTASFSVSGSAIYICIVQFNGMSRGINVNVDGVDKGTYSNTGYIPPTTALFPAISYAPYLIRVAGLKNNLHRVVLTVTNGVGNAYFMWASGNTGINEKESPELYVGNCLRMGTYASDYEGGVFGHGSDTAVANLNNTLESYALDLAGDGLNVYYVDASGYFNPSTDMSTDTVHPNDAGHAKLASAFLARMNTFRRNPIPRATVIDSVKSAGNYIGLYINGSVYYAKRDTAQ